jgi:hypothetical protein
MRDFPAVARPRPSVRARKLTLAALVAAFAACGGRSALDLGTEGESSPDGGATTGGDANGPDSAIGAKDGSPADTSFADAGSGCANTCTAGTLICESGGIATCTMPEGGAGCATWGPPVRCGRDEICVGGDGGAPRCVGIESPRPIAPLSTSTVTSQRPTLHWALAPGDTGAQVDVCRDRACTDIVVTFPANGTSGKPPDRFTPGVYYWRLRGIADGAVGAQTSVVWEFVVSVANATVDTSWGSMADVDGDGYADVILGVPSAGQSAGEIQVYPGGAAPLSTTPAILEVPNPGKYPVYSVASAGDVNGDGFADVVVGVSDGAGVSPGQAYLYLGGPLGISTTATALAAPAGQDFGESVSGAGDVNGDGYADFLVMGTDHVILFFGGASGPLLAARVAPELSLPFSGAGAGDVNGDGFGDIVVGDLAIPSNNAGAAFVYFGGPSGLSSAALTLTGPTEQLALFGYTLACAGDVNGDGFADIAVGAPGESPAVYVFLGSAGGPSASLPALSDPSKSPVTIQLPFDEAFGGALASAGDVNGDGFSDVLVGASIVDKYQGAAYLYLGGPRGVANAPELLQRMDAGGHFGRLVAGGGDVDRDGFDDVLIGSPALGLMDLYPGGMSGLSASVMTFTGGSGSGMGASGAL